MGFQKIIFVLLLIASSCQKKTADDKIMPEGFEATPSVKPLTPGMLDEASGIADSKTNPGYIWVEQDGGNTNDISLLSYEGIFLKKINIKSAINHDWEDIVMANGPVAGTNYIYLADIGDNNLSYSTHYIYRFAEPVATTDTVFTCDTISFKYPDGAHDADALLIDNNTKDIYIITKRDAHSLIYKLTYPQSITAANTALLSGSLSFNDVTSAALSPDGKEMLVRTYRNIYYWKNKNGKSVEQALTDIPVTLDYQFEPQGEAICFKNDNTGFYTLSERPSVIAAVKLNYYKRK